MTISDDGINKVKSVNRAGRIYQTDKGSASSSKPGETVKSKDVANVSEQAMLLAKTRAALEAVPEVRTDRVDELKQQIANGTYSVPLDQLASVLLKHLNP